MNAEAARRRLGKFVRYEEDLSAMAPGSSGWPPLRRIIDVSRITPKQTIAMAEDLDDALGALLSCKARAEREEEVAELACRIVFGERSPELYAQLLDMTGYLDR
jgi:hypothetical protein